MKSYEETAFSVMEKIEKHRTAQKRKRQIVLGTTIPLCSICLIVAMGFFSMESRLPKPAADSPIPAVSEPPTEPVSAQAPQNTIVIHPIEETNNEQFNIALFRDDFISMTKDQVNDYYGINVYPAVPEDLSMQKMAAGIYKRNGGTGEIYHDQNRQDYRNEKDSRHIVVETRKGKLPFFQFVIPDVSSGNSIINGQDVTIGINEYGWYSAWFLYQDVGFYIGAEGITQDELINVISSLIPS